MGKRKYRTVVAAVMAGAVLFSPLLCGMTCREGLWVRVEATETMAPATELTGELVGGAVVGCVLPHLVAKIDFGGWADEVDVRTWFWIAVEALRLSDGLWREGVLQGTVLARQGCVCSQGLPAGSRRYL
ncbi:MAG TPA: hypothetical protein VGR58_13415 [Candidatus Acidoferrum sp.]|nr:hypothetical protein [Candidatus Acidoferrum sp.]